MLHQDQNLHLKQQPMPMMLQSLSLLSMDTEALSEFVHTAVSANPLLEYPDGSDSDSHTRFIYNLPEREKDLYAVLLDQLHTMHGVSAFIADAAEFLIGNLDRDGYLRTELHDLAIDSRYTLADLSHALELIQHMDPPGVGARSLQECLLLQLDRREPADDCARILVIHHLESLAKGLPALPAFAPAQVEAAAALIRSLSPRPGQQLPSDEAPGVCIPDLEISLSADGRPEVRLLPPFEMPMLSPLYRDSYRLIKEETAAAYIRTHAANARMLLYALERRGNTLLEIGRCIADRQAPFFTGSGDLLPLTIAEIARALALSPSTVSRGMRNKYLLFNGKIHPLSAFLNARLASGHSPAQVKARILHFLQQSPHKRLSDQRLTELLAEEGVLIARRTVNKYRQELNLPPKKR